MPDSDSVKTDDFVIVSRKNDPHTFRVPTAAIKKIKPAKRHETEESYKTGGLSFYDKRAEHAHTSERGAYLLFSIDMDLALNDFSEVCKNFNFPPSDAYPSGIIQAA